MGCPAGGLVAPLTVAEVRVLKLLPSSAYPQTGATLLISRNTLNTHVRSIYHKLGVSCRQKRAVSLRLL